MKLVFGGAYQGKKKFAQERLMSDQTLLVEYEAVSSWISRCLDEGKAPEENLREILPEENLDNTVVIMEDISLGLVPMDSKERAFREANGRVMIRLAEEGEEVYRVFCGIGARIK